MLSVKRKLYHIPGEAIQLSMVHIQWGVVFCGLFTGNTQNGQFNGDKNVCLGKTLEQVHTTSLE